MTTTPRSRGAGATPNSSAETSRRRVCVLTETYFPVVGGGETQAKALAEGLSARGWEVVVVTRRSNRAFAKRDTVGGVVVHRLAPAGPHHLKKWGLLVSASWALFRRRKGYDVVVVSGFRLLGVPAALARIFLGKACILKADSLGEMSGEYFAPGLAKLRMRPSSPPFRLFLAVRDRVLRSANMFVAMSSAIADELIAGGVRAESVRRIPNSVDTQRFAPPPAPAAVDDVRERLGLPTGVPIVVYTGRLVTYKGLPTLVHAWRRVYKEIPEAKLVLVGGGGLDIHSCEAALAEYVVLHDLSLTVRMTGDVTNVHEYLQAADLFVLPTQNEAFGISLIEAMATGLPVISTPVGGIPDIVRDGENGVLVEPGNEPALRNALLRLLGDRDLAARLGRAARRDAVDRYATEQVVVQYAALIEGLLATPHLVEAR